MWEHKLSQIMELRGCFTPTGNLHKLRVVDNAIYRSCEAEEETPQDSLTNCASTEIGKRLCRYYNL